jgi:hypothetical protein
MALAPDTAPWYRRFRMMIGIYLIATAFGVREYVVSRSTTPVGMGTEDWSRMAEVVSRINPADADSEFLDAMEAMRAGDAEGFVRHMEIALAKNVKHNDILLHAYAQHLFTTQADYVLVNRALTRWRVNHPASGERFEIPLGAGPRDFADEGAIRRALEGVDWVLSHEIRRPTDAQVGWRVLLSFRPATEIDIRQAVAAVSILGLTPEQRLEFRVTCLTLENCRMVPR